MACQEEVSDLSFLNQIFNQCNIMIDGKRVLRGSINFFAKSLASLHTLAGSDEADQPRQEDAERDKDGNTEADAEGLR